MTNRLRRLEKVEAALDAGLLILKLDDGTTARLDRAADLRLGFALWQAQAEARERGEDVVTFDHPHIEVFARSVPRAGEGLLTQSVRAYCRMALDLPADEPRLIL